MGTLANSEDPDEMPLNAAFHQDLHCSLRQNRSSTCDPSIYKMNYPDFTVSNLWKIPFVLKGLISPNTSYNQPDQLQRLTRILKSGLLQVDSYYTFPKEKHKPHCDGSQTVLVQQNQMFSRRGPHFQYHLLPHLFSTQIWLDRDFTARTCNELINWPNKLSPMSVFP